MYFVIATSGLGVVNRKEILYKQEVIAISRKFIANRTSKVHNMIREVMKGERDKIRWRVLVFILWVYERGMD